MEDTAIPASEPRTPMRDEKRLNSEETAQALGVNKDVAKMRLRRSRAKIRNALDAHLRA